MSDIDEILKKASEGGQAMSGELLALVYDELRTLASQRMAWEGPGQTLQATALVHEAWLKLTHDEGRTWNDRAHFFRAAAQAMRRILVDRARAKARLKRGGERVEFDDQVFDVAETTADERVLLVDEVLGKLEREDPECARVITLKFFAGLTNQEIAELEGIGDRTVDRRWAFAKIRLFQLIQEAQSGKGESNV